MKKIIVGISGASGAILAKRFIDHLLSLGHEVHATLSDSGHEVFKEELAIDLGDSNTLHGSFAALYKNHPRLFVYNHKDMAAKISSGSNAYDAMVVVPCSMSTVACIAHGITGNLIQRAASVCVKERRSLILVPRESPLSTIHLRNMLTLSELGVMVVPATTAFYNKPKTIEEMVDFTLGRVLDLLKIEHKLFRRWEGGHAE